MTPRCIKQRALLTENRELKLPSPSVLPLIMFSSIAQVGQVRLRWKSRRVFSAHQLSLWACWHLPVFEWCSSVISAGHFLQMHEEVVSSWPHKKGPKCPRKPSLIRKQRRVRPCRSSPVHMCSFKAFTYAIIPFPLPLSLSERAVSILYPVCRSVGWEHDGRQGQLFSSSSKSQDDPCAGELHFAKRCFSDAAHKLPNRRETISLLYRPLLTSTLPFQPKSAVRFLKVDSINQADAYKVGSYTIRYVFLDHSPPKDKLHYGLFVFCLCLCVC